jgi:hypothetical protein
MTRPDHDPDGSTRADRDTPATGTHAGADVTGRMSGTHDTTSTHDAQHAATPTDSTGGDRHDRVEEERVEEERYEERVIPPKYKTAKTSAAATFALVFGLAALFCALTGILAPVAVLLGVIGIVLGIAGLKMTKRLGVTGKGVAIGGLITAILGFLLGAAVLAGVAVYVNDQGLDRLQQQFDDAVQNAPSGREIVEQVPGTN